MEGFEIPSLFERREKKPFGRHNGLFPGGVTVGA